MDNTLGHRIELIRKTERYDIDEFMKSIEVSKTAYYGWKNGDYYPGSDVLIRILTKFPEYNAEWLLMGTGQMKKSGQNNELREPAVKYTGKDDVKGEIKRILKKMIDNIDDV